MARNVLHLLPPAITQKQGLELLVKITDAKSVLTELEDKLKHKSVGEHILPLLSLAEAVHSIRIEGFRVKLSDILDGPYGAVQEEERLAVVNYQEALKDGLRLSQDKTSAFSTDFVCNLHKILMGSADHVNKDTNGRFRQVQNFIGADANIKYAVYIPPASDKIASFMDNLVSYVNGTEQASAKEIRPDSYVLDARVHPLLRLAILHAQFESIHPFTDGNGRLGRILLTIMAVKLGVVCTPCFLLSEELARDSERYYDFLNGVREDSPDYFSYLSFFLDRVTCMAETMLERLARVNDLTAKALAVSQSHCEKEAYLATLSRSYITAEEISEDHNISLTKARAVLDLLAGKELLFAVKSIEHYRPYINYDLRHLLT